MRLGLPDRVTACLFDLDGVLTETAVVHAAAWKHTFDAVLKQLAPDDPRPFDKVADYDEYVDGKPREDGVRDFLASRRITVAEGGPDDPPDALTVHGIGNRKNLEVISAIDRDGVAVYPGSLAYLKAAQQAGLRRVLVSSSANAVLVLRRTGLDAYIQAVVDGNTLTSEHLRGKPAPDSYLAGARVAGVQPADAAVFEDALAGVEAGRAGRFGHVVGVDRVGQAAELEQHGADTVVSDLSELLDSDR
jgi:beta-phosphoglucomutase family hydrolase